jgi:decaprenylphospho-beta-D-erythro-pentofuranosid-2-ulose 2-reductase
MSKQKIVIIGASSAIAEHCARIWVQQAACDMVLVGRNLEKLEIIATDLRVRNPASSINYLQVNFNDAQAIGNLVNDIAGQGRIDIALIAHGTLPDQQACQSDLQQNADAICINGISPVLFAEAFARHMQAADHGNLALIGSVAGDRGRKSNYVYGAAKGLVTRYAQGLQHRLASGKVRLSLIKPGPTDTPMTSHLKNAGAKLASVEAVAQTIINGIQQGKPVIYAPGKWALIMMIIRHLPNFVFNKMDI